MPPPLAWAEGIAFAFPTLLLSSCFTLRGALSFLISALKAKFTGRTSLFAG